MDRLLEFKLEKIIWIQKSTGKVSKVFYPMLFSLLEKMTRHIFTNFIILIVFANLVFGFESGESVDFHESNYEGFENSTVKEKGK